MGPWGPERPPERLSCQHRRKAQSWSQAPLHPAEAQMCGHPSPGPEGGLLSAHGTLHFTHRCPWSPLLGQPGPPLPSPSPHPLKASTGGLIHWLCGPTLRP